MPNVLAKAKHNRKRQAERRKRLKARLAAAVVLCRPATVGSVVRRAATAGMLTHVHALPAICTMCGRRRAGCPCMSQDPPVGKLQQARFRQYLRFMVSDTRRRTLADCLDVILMCGWARQFLADGGSMRMVFMAIFCFRHFNRLTTWQAIVEALSSDATHPRWAVLEENLRCLKAQFKPFSRPPLLKDCDGNVIGRDATDNALTIFTIVWQSKHTTTICELLCNVVTTVENYRKLKAAYDNLQTQVPGALGTYRRKSQFDIWSEIGALRGSALEAWLVATQCGTALSLKYLYGLSLNCLLPEQKLVDLLNHFWHQFRQHSPPCMHGRDNLPTVTLTLCGWHRRRQSVQHNGRWTDGLTRAIEVEEEECLELRQALRDTNM